MLEVTLVQYIGSLSLQCCDRRLALAEACELEVQLPDEKVTLGIAAQPNRFILLCHTWSVSVTLRQKYNASAHDGSV